ncbi:hypothetical protein FLM9_646 [Candidatus Synechococcus spongiarum]|uniref:Uncharacterized protein n=1 Tax=Candidatus Synechococcus spongiarum TaxID=431041 RepID=A0A164YWL3_9SYNE|nr:hypothetical protein FLM9_646 [Candidatus Synechococcus spongiarum]
MGVPSSHLLLSEQRQLTGKAASFAWLWVHLPIDLESVTTWEDLFRE